MSNKDDDIKATLALILSQQTALIQQGERNMTAIQDAVNNLKKEVGETLTAIQAKLDELRAKVEAGTDPTLVDDVNAASAQLDALQQTLAVPEP